VVVFAPLFGKLIGYQVVGTAVRPSVVVAVSPLLKNDLT